jgi:hypothetical protein
MEKTFRLKLLAAAFAALAIMGACSDDDGGDDAAGGAVAVAADEGDETELAEELSNLAADAPEELNLEASDGVALRNASVAETLEEAEAGELPSPAPSVDPSASPAPDALGGVLGSLLQTQVGTYQLQSASSNQQAIDNGALEALVTIYADPAAPEEGLLHMLELYGTAEQANATMSSIVSGATGSGFTVNQTISLTDNAGQAIGTATAMTSAAGSQMVVWTDLNLVLVAGGANGVDFFNNCPY